MRDEETKRRGDAVKSNASPRTSSLRLSVSPSLPRAFTLTKILIVVGLIVLLLLLALPAFNFITGGPRVPPAHNQAPPTDGADFHRACQCNRRQGPYD